MGAPVIRADELECTACGACCFGLIVRVHPEAEARLTAEELVALTRIDEEAGRILRQREDGACSALVRSGGRFLCAIYERRPAACAAFERGSKRCLDWRRDRGVG